MSLTRRIVTLGCILTVVAGAAAAQPLDTAGAESCAVRGYAKDSDPKGTIYSYSVMRRAPVPYAMAYVTLAEGPRMVTNIVDCDLDKLKVEQPVKVVFKPSDGGPPLPMFTPA